MKIYKWTETLETTKVIRYALQNPNVSVYYTLEVETDRDEIKKLYNRWLDADQVLGLLYDRQQLLNEIAD